MKKYIVLFLAAAVLLGCWLRWENNALQVTKITVTDPEIPEAFSGFRIAQISDLHNAEFGRENEKLLTLLAGTMPDIIVITGDLVDSRRMDLAVALEFARKAVAIAPCYYAAGNHEGRTRCFDALEEGLLAAGVCVLRNEGILLTRQESSITLMGVDDPALDLFQKLGPNDEVFRQRLQMLAGNITGYTILLSHRPEEFDQYAQLGFDLVFSGHAHGGQIRLPFVGGLLAPGQGIFPEYDSGLHVRADTAMIVSRGLGNSAFPFRINNRPEIVLAELKSE